MQVDTFFKPNWPHKLVHHIWLTGSLDQLRDAETWTRQWMNDHNIEGGFAGPQSLTPLMSGEDPAYRVIVMTTKPIDAMMLKLSVW